MDFTLKEIVASMKCTSYLYDIKIKVMKLYTEEQVRGLVMALCDYNILKEEVAMRELTPIELPSDEDIKHCIGSVNYTEYDNGFIQGIKWVKEQILNQNK